MMEHKEWWNHQLGPITITITFKYPPRHIVTYGFKTVARAARFIEPWINNPGLSEPDQYAWEIHGCDMRALYEFLALGASSEDAAEAG